MNPELGIESVPQFTATINLKSANNHSRKLYSFALFQENFRDPFIFHTQENDYATDSEQVDKAKRTQS